MAKKKKSVADDIINGEYKDIWTQAKEKTSSNKQSSNNNLPTKENVRNVFKNIVTQGINEINPFNTNKQVNNTRLPINNNQNNFQLPVNNRVQNYNTTNTFPTSNNINRNNIGQTQKSTSQKVFETLNPGKKIIYKNEQTKLPSKTDLIKNILTTGAAISKGENASKLVNNTFNTIQNLGTSAYKGILQFGKVLNERLADNQNNMIKTDNFIMNNMKDKEKARAILSGQANLLGTYYNEENNTIDEIKYEDINKNIQNKIDEENRKTAKRIEESTGLGKTTAELASSLGNNLVGAVGSAINPALGLTYFVGSATGSYEDDAKERGMEGNKAKLYSGIMGAFEGVGDYVFGYGALNKGLSAVGKESIGKAVTSFGETLLGSGLENAFQEGITEPINELVATAVGGKDKANWDNIGQRIFKSAEYGFLSGLIFDGIGRGVGSIANIQNKLNNGQEITQNDIKDVVKDLEESGMTRQEILENAKNNAIEAVNTQINKTNKRINNSNLSAEDKANMLNYVENKDFTQADYNDMREKIDIANNQETLYNNNESESEINGFKGDTIERGNRIYEKQKNNQNRKYNWEEYNKWEQSIRPITEKSLTNEERNSINKAKQEHNKDIVLYDEKNNENTYSGGASKNVANKITISKQKAEMFGLDNMISHEIVESDILHNEQAKDILSPIIDLIKEDKNFDLQKTKFWEEQENNMPSDNLIAKDILCDRFSEIKNNGKMDYENVLSNSTNSSIDMALSNYYKQVYGKELGLPSSFIMPTVENTKKDNTQKVAPYRTEEQIAKDTSISDIDAIREASKQVETSTLPIAEQKENSLKSENIDRSPTIDYIKKKRSKEKLSVKEIKDTLAQKFVNKGHYIDKLAKQTNNKKLTHLYDRTMNTFNEAQISIGDNQINSKGEVVGKSLTDVFQPSVDAGLETQFEDYLLNLHNIDRYAHEKGIYGEEISASDSRKIADQYKKDYPIFKEWKEDVYKYNDNNLKDLVNNGLVSQDTYDKLKSLYGNYIPTFRDIVDNVSEYLDDTVGSNPLKRATQSDRDILSVKEAMAEQTLMQKKAIRMNNLGLELYKTLGKDSTVLEGIQVDPIAMQTLSGDVIEKATDGSNIFTIFDNGEMKQFKISDELYSAFSKDTLQNRINNSKTAKAILTPIEKMSKAQRELLTTYSVGFAMNNPIKDFQDALFNTKYSGTRFVKNWTKALYNIGTNGTWYENYKNNGGTANTYFDYNKGLLPTKTKNPLKKFANAIKSVNEVLEQAPRLAEYISTIETGGSVDEALYNASEVTTNFKRGGDITKAVNKYGVNFLNASVQGLDKAYRNITGQNGVKGYANLLTKATLYQIAPAILNGIIFRDDKDYEDLPEYTKDNYFLFKMGDGKFFRIPKGRVSAVIGGIARRALETAEGKDVDWKSLIDTTINQLAPNNPLTDNIVAPIKQAVDNKSWYGGDIVSTRLQKLPVAEQSDETTDKFSKWLGERLNISPKKINYAYRWKWRNKIEMDSSFYRSY